MKHYCAYMDRQQVSEDLHTRLLEMEIPQARPRRWTQYAVLAACCVLLLGIGAWKWLTLPAGENNASEMAQSTDTVDALNNVGAVGSNGSDSDWNSGEYSFTADSRTDITDLEFPYIPAIRYGDMDSQGVFSTDIALPEGSFTLPLTEEQISRILWGGQENEANVPWMLGWDGALIQGTAWYDGYGDLWRVDLYGQFDSENEFFLELAPDQVPITCMEPAMDSETDVRGVTVSSYRAYYDRDGDDVNEYLYKSTFVAHNVGVRTEFMSETESQLNDLLINWCTYEDGGLSLEHLMKAENVPAFRSADFDSLEAARQETTFAPYLPTADPEGAWDEFYGHLTYQEGITNRLFVRWSLGYDDVRVFVDLPEGESIVDTVDIDAPETYDLRLYTIPWCDSVPYEVLNTVSCPTFRAEDMSRDVIAARQVEKDTGGYSYTFQVLHPDGTLVEYGCSGVTIDQMWAMVEETL